LTKNGKNLPGDCPLSSRGLSPFPLKQQPSSQATPTRDAFRYISGNLYSNTLQVVMAPMRAVTQVTDFRKLSSRADLNRRLKQFRKFVRGNKDK
jgi:hypothetical protein